MELTEQDARDRASELLRTLPPPSADDGWVITSIESRDAPAVWLVRFINRRYAETRDMLALATGPRLLVDKATGAAEFFSNALPLDDALREHGYEW